MTLPKKAQQMSGVKTFIQVRLSLSHVANLNVLLHVKVLPFRTVFVFFVMAQRWRW